MKSVFPALATAALIISLWLLVLFNSMSTRLDSIDRNLSDVRAEVSLMASPSYQQQQFNERLGKVLDEVRRRQEIALAPMP